MGGGLGEAALSGFSPLEWVWSIVDLMEPMGLRLCCAGLCPSWAGGEQGADLKWVQAPVDIPSPMICKKKNLPFHQN